MAEMPEETIVEEPITEEESDAQLVEKVTKMLHPEDTPAEEAETPAPEAEETADGEEPVEFTDELKALATGAGLSEDLAQRLHESGQLEETLAAFDRRMIDHVQSKEKDEGKREQEPQAKDQDETPALDPELYDEAIIKRDAYQSKRIDALEAQLQELLQERQSGFDEWFDGALTELGVDTNDNDKCQAVFRAYGAICEAFGINPSAGEKAMVKRAYTALYPQEVFKAKQRQTVDRLRDAQGKFLSRSPAKEPPPSRQMTEEESNDALVARVTGYLKEQGVQMSGY